MVDEVRRLALRGYYICARGVGAGVAPTEQVAERVERAVGRGWNYMYAYVRVCTGEG